MERIGDILKINGFKATGTTWNRDDGVQFHNGAVKFIAFGDGEVFYPKTTYEAIGYMACNNIINRLF